MSITSQDLQFFAEVARAGSLAAAARALDVTLSAVSQRLQHLERRLGVRLVVRSARRLTLTDEGQLLSLRGQAIIDDLGELAETVTHRQGAVSGHLRVLAPFGFGRAYVARAVAEFDARYPDVTIELHVSDRLGRVPDYSWDVAVHIGVLHDSALVAQPLAPNARIACAAPQFLERYGFPETPADLRRLACIAIRENDEDVTLWRFIAPDGENLSVRVEPRMSSNDGEIVREWALDGHGIMVRSEWSVARDLREGRLIRVLDAYTQPRADIVALVAPRFGRAARTQAFVQHLREALTPAPWLR
ncbi:MAG: LysR substrate-binding domain-containing protein [Gemmatimonadota bacterium]